MKNSITINKSVLLKNKFVKITLSTVFILGLWEILALIVNDSFVLPDAFETLKSLVKIVSSEGWISTVLISLYRVFLGLIIGSALGIIFASLCHYFPLISFLISPVFSIMKATPVACIIVLLWLSMNYTQLTIFVVIMMIMPIIWQNILDGYKSIDKSLIEVAKVFNFSMKKKIKVLIIPSLLPYFLPALITSVGMAWKAEIAAEIMTGSNVGRLIYDFKNISYDTASIFAWTVIIIALSLVFEGTAKYLIRRIYRGLNLEASKQKL